MLQSTGQEMREQPHSQAAQQRAEPGSLAKPGFLPLIPQPLSNVSETSCHL